MKVTAYMIHDMLAIFPPHHPNVATLATYNRVDG